MFKNYLLLALRNFKKNPIYSLVNVLCLTLGLLSVYFVLAFIDYELSYDQHYEDSENIYRVGITYAIGSQIDAFCNAPRPLLGALKNEFAEISDVTRLYGVNQLSAHEGRLKFKDKEVESKQLFYADSTFFDVFAIPLIRGTPNKALKHTQSVVLTEKLAYQLFGQVDVLGKTLKLDDISEWTVTGIIPDINRPTHLPFEALFSWDGAYRMGEEDMWYGWHVYSYIKLDKGAKATFISNNFDRIFNKYMQGRFDQIGGTASLIVQPLTSIHLDSNLTWEAYANGDRDLIYIFSIVSVFLLVIASINYINLSIIQSIRRSTEVGIRKVFGVRKINLVYQYIAEATFYAFLALLLTFLLSYIALPRFNYFTGYTFTFQELLINTNSFWIVVLAAIIGVLSGIYPAFYVSSFKSVDILKGSGSLTNSKATLRRVLVSVQFYVSIVLLLGTLVVFRQLDFMKNKDLGFSKDNVIVVKAPDQDSSIKMPMLKNKIEQIKGVQFVSISNNIPGLALNQTLFEVPDENGNLSVAGGQFMGVDYNFFKTLNVELVEGRNFNVATGSDFNSNIIINETAVERFDLGPEPIGKYIISGTDSLNNPLKFTVIGVVEDYHMGSLHTTIEPIVTFGIREASNFLIIKTDGSEVKKLMSAIQDNYKAVLVDKPFDYVFFDESFAVLYQSEELLFDVLLIFLTVTLFITCVGLIGLVSYSTEQRKREVGIRKVLGSDSFSLLKILTKEYVIITLLAFVAATITSWYGIKKWFETFAYHTSIKWSDYALVLCGFLLIMFLSSIYQITRAMIANPIKIIRSEN